MVNIETFGILLVITDSKVIRYLPTPIAQLAQIDVFYHSGDQRQSGAGVPCLASSRPTNARPSYTSRIFDLLNILQMRSSVTIGPQMSSQAWFARNSCLMGWRLNSKSAAPSGKIAIGFPFASVPIFKTSTALKNRRPDEPAPMQGLEDHIGNVYFDIQDN